MQHAKAPPRKARVYCGQNRLDPSLCVNGGALELGTGSKCFRYGFGAALHQQINDSAPPEGYQPATLSQVRQRGFGAGSATLACKLREKHKLRVAE